MLRSNGKLGNRVVSPEEEKERLQMGRIRRKGTPASRSIESVWELERSRGRSYV